MAKKTLYFDKTCGFTVTAAVENGKLTDCRFQKEDGAPEIGNIYKGTVVNVLEGMQAAFVNCGLERNCYLAAEDIVPYGSEGGIKNVKAGDRIMVQIVKTPCGKKGAKVTAHLAFVGKALIYLPNTDFVGISHRIEDKELRESLILAAGRAKRRGEGLVVRNAAPFCKYNRIDDELNYLRAIYERVAETFAKAPPGTLLYTDFSMPVRVLREFSDRDVECIYAGNAAQWRELDDFLKIVPEGNFIKLGLHSGRRDMLEEAGILGQIVQTCSPRVDLEKGAYLIIERTEALTSIDVNTGGFIGEDNLEYTVYHTNLAAAREIARQVKLRNIGGLVVVDFIDMRQPEHKKAIVEELEKALSRDGAPFRVLPMSDFGLVEFTRKRSGPELSAFTLKPCALCGKPYGFSDDFFACLARAELLKALDGGAEKAILELSADDAKTIAARNDVADSVRQAFPHAEVYLLPSVECKKGAFLCRKEKKNAKIPSGAIKFL